jgi:type IX secretion system substrate protein/VCBS repeat protein/FG-GAP repeat protein
MKKLIITIAITCCINANAQICFDPIKIFKPIGQQAITAASVTSADFNGDGKADLVTTNNFIDAAGTGVTCNASLLLGTGNGNFTTVADTFYVGFGASQVISTDFNNDGKADIATANFSIANPSYQGSVTVLLGTGSGSFLPGTNFPSGYQPTSITSADFNRDGFADFATANPGTESVWISLGTGTGSFGTANSFSVSGHPWSVISADFNNDGKTDLATANGDSNSVSILLGTGTGGFGAASTFSAGVTSWWRDTAIANPYGGMAQQLTSGDFNGDGKIDLAVAHNDTTMISILLGNGAGGFGAITNFKVDASGSPSQIIVGDFNGDGKADIASANAYDCVFGTQNPYIPQLVVVNNSISVLLGNGAGGFGTSTSFTVGIGPQWVTSSDFNGDGKADLATVDTAVTVLLNCTVLGIEKFDGSNEINIYPNPNNGSFVIETNSTEKQTMQIYDINGKLVLNQTINGKTNIDASNLADGVYNISLLSNDGITNKRVVIVR